MISNCHARDGLGNFRFSFFHFPYKNEWMKNHFLVSKGYRWSIGVGECSFVHFSYEIEWMNNWTALTPFWECLILMQDSCTPIPRRFVGNSCPPGAWHAQGRPSRHALRHHDDCAVVCACYTAIHNKKRKTRRSSLLAVRHVRSGGRLWVKMG